MANRIAGEPHVAGTNLETYIIENEAVVRLTAFFGVFALMAFWEVWQPCRVPRIEKTRRWINNLGLVVLNTVILRLLFPAAAVGVALFASTHGWGILNFLSPKRRR